MKYFFPKNEKTIEAENQIEALKILNNPKKNVWRSKKTNKVKQKKL